MSSVHDFVHLGRSWEFNNRNYNDCRDCRFYFTIEINFVKHICLQFYIIFDEYLFDKLYSKSLLLSHFGMMSFLFKLCCGWERVFKKIMHSKPRAISHLTIEIT